MKLLREPLLHFLVIGLAIYLLIALAGKDEPVTDRRELLVTAGQVAWLVDSFTARWTRPPTPEERQGLIDAYVRETVLYREAQAMGLEADDVIIRRRLAQKLEFLFQDLADAAPPTDEQLRVYFDEHRDRYQEPVLYTFTQVFVDPDKRGDATLADAEEIKILLIAKGDDFADVGELSDSLMLQEYIPGRSQSEIQRQFGGGFADSVAELSPGQWHGPILSGFGVHLVFVHDRTEPPPPDFEAVRKGVAEDWRYDRRERMNEELIANLLARYDVVIEDEAAEPAAQVP